MKAHSETEGHYRIDRDEAGNETITDLNTGRVVADGMHIAGEHNATTVVEMMLEEEAMREDDGE